MVSPNLPILYAEDEPNDVFFLQAAFRAAEILNPLHIANNGQEAINYLAGVGPFADRSRYPLPCLVILDLKMPAVDGFEVIEWLRGESKLPLPVIMFSSSAHPGDIERAYALGVNAFVVKPLGVPERNDLFKKVKGFWLDWNEPPLLDSLRWHPNATQAPDPNGVTER